MVNGRWTSREEWGTADFSADMTMSDYGTTKASSIRRSPARTLTPTTSS